MKGLCLLRIEELIKISFSLSAQLAKLPVKVEGRDDTLSLEAGSNRNPTIVEVAICKYAAGLCWVRTQSIKSGRQIDNLTRN